MALSPVYILASDDPLLKNERSNDLLAQARAQMPQAELMIFTYSDFQSTGPQANLARLENELIDPGLFGGDRIIKIYLKELNRTSVQVLHLIAGRMRDGVVIIIELPRIPATFKQFDSYGAPKGVKPAPYKDKLGKAESTATREVFSFLYHMGAQVEIMYPPDGMELIGWITNRCSKYSLSIDRDAANFLATTCEGNLVAIDQSLQIIAMTAPNQRLTADIIDKNFTKDSRYSGFELAETLLSGNSMRALNILASVCNATNNLTEPLSLILGRLDAALKVVPLARINNVARLDKFKQTAFFMSNGIVSFAARDAITKAATQMPRWLYDALVDELATANKLYCSMRFNEAYLSLQNMCMMVTNGNATLFKPLCKE